jgi:hypothetical protein
MLPHGGFLVDYAFPLKTYLPKPYSHRKKDRTKDFQLSIK